MQVVRRSGLVYHSYSLDFGSLTAMLWNGLSDFKEWFKLLVLYYYTTSSLCLCILQCDQISTRNFLTFVNTTAIACHQNLEALVVFLPVCNSSRVYKRQKITSTCTSAVLAGAAEAECCFSVVIQG